MPPGEDDVDPFAPAVRRPEHDDPAWRADHEAFRAFVESDEAAGDAIEEEWRAAARAAHERDELDDMPSMLTTDEVAAYLRLSEYQVREHLRREVLPGLRVGERWRVQREALRTWIEEAARRPAVEAKPQPAVEEEPKQVPPRRRRRGEGLGY